jgi:protein-disulfide isomerase
MISKPATRLTLPVGPRDHILGPSTAPVTLVEYGDFECSHCGHAHSVVKTLLKHLGRQLRFAYRHFPLATAHPRAEPAAEAAEAAGAQGKFWPMHDTLFEHQEALEDEDLLLYGTDLGLDVPNFVSDLINGVYAPKVREDFMSGVRSGVNGTPSFFINGVRHDDSYDFDVLLAAIVSAMEDAE